MKDMFPGYYHPSEQVFREAWTTCTFVFDANVLLGLYRYPERAREDLLGIMTKLEDRIWIPHQVALEYQSNRLITISEQVKRYQELDALLTDVYDKLKVGVESLQLEKRHSRIQPNQLLQNTQEVFNQFREQMNALKSSQLDINDPDAIRDKLDVLFRGKVGPAPIGQDDLDKIYSEGESRYKILRPPGFTDQAKSKDGEPDIRFNCGLAFKRIYGDLIVWKQILDECSKRKLTHVIFVTDDNKEDWWWKIRSEGEKTIGPRPELVDEITKQTSVEFFWMYNSERFMAYAKQYINADINPASIEQVRDVADAQEVSQQNFSRWVSEAKRYIKQHRYRIGQKVTHLKFGTGIVLRAYGEGDDAQVNVLFPDFGEKRLAVKYARLQPVEPSEADESRQLIDDEEIDADEIDPFADE